MAQKRKYNAADYLSARELRKAQYLYNKLVRSSSPRGAAIYEKQLKRLYQLAHDRKKQGKARVNRSVKIESPKGTIALKNKSAEDIAQIVAKASSRPKK